MHATDYGTAALAVCAIIGIIVAIVNWFFKRGADEREFSVALRDNTAATRELSQKLDGVVETLHAHDLRISRLEYQPSPIHVTTQVEAPSRDRTPAYRDPGPS
jgi:hypothetical protein